jgi:outer membrane protein TolC
MRAIELWPAASLALWLAFAADANAQTTRHPQLDALVSEAVQHHPEIRRARRAAAAAWQVPSRLDSLPDPMLSVAVQNLRTDKPSLDGSPMSGIEIGLKQDIPFPGKLVRRSEVATEMARASERSVKEEAALIALHVREAYWRLHFAERAEGIALENEKVLGSLASTVLGRFSVGRGAQQDALQAQVAHGRVRALVEERHEAVQAAKHTLNGVVGRSPGAAVAATEDPAAEVPSLDRQALLAGQATRASVDDAILRGAAERLRPKMMTVSAIIFGLLPVMWSAGAGASVMKRVAAPMIGGMLTSALVTLLVLPIVYQIVIGRRRLRVGSPEAKL